jgi:2-oxoglutarate ferredoxin oxidoreductase subunit alpha
VLEARARLAAEGVPTSFLRVRGFPFGREIADFVARHERTFVVEQNRDGQLRTLLAAEGDVDPARLGSIRHYGGMPLSAGAVVRDVRTEIDRPLTVEVTA